MATELHMNCGGCDAQISVRVRRTFHSLNGSGYGFGRYHTPTIDELVEPTGWVWADLIGCTYCPECWKQINADSEQEQSSQEDPGNMWAGAETPFAENH